MTYFPQLQTEIKPVCSSTASCDGGSCVYTRCCTPASGQRDGSISRCSVYEHNSSWPAKRMAFSKQLTVFTRILLVFGGTDTKKMEQHTQISLDHWSAPPHSEDFHPNCCFLLRFSFYGQILKWQLVDVVLTDLLLKGKECTFYVILFKQVFFYVWYTLAF